MTLIDFAFPKLRTVKRLSDKCLKSPASEDISTSNILNVSKLWWQHFSFSLFIDHCQVNWVGKSLCFWHANYWGCLLTHWLPMKSFLFLTEAIISETKSFFWIFCSIFDMYNKLWISWKKIYGPHRFCISKITDSQNQIIKMSIKSCFRGSFNKEHGKSAEPLLKSVSQHL